MAESRNDRRYPPTRLPTVAQLPKCERLWTFQDVSDFLGVPIGTLYQWRVRGEGPPAFKVGRHVRFDPDQVRTWLAATAA